MCHMTFIRKGDMVCHQHLHSGDRPYCCDVCPMTFIWKCDMVYHQSIHSGERPYPCDVCNKTFIKKTRMVRYKHTHIGEWAYPWCAQYSIWWRDEPIKPSIYNFFCDILKFFYLNDAAYNLNKIMLNFLSIVFDNVSYFY